MTNKELFDLFNNDPETFWRVDWYGYIKIADELGEKYIDPRVEMYLSLVKDKYNLNLNNKNATEFHNQLKIVVPVEWLCVFRIGDVINQKVVFRRGEENHRIEEFQNVLVNSDNVYHVASGAKSQTGQYYLPKPYHPYHLQSTRTRCAIVSLSPSKKLVIPHYVLLQTYFSSCSYVFRQLFQHGLYLESLYDEKSSFIEQNGRAFIHLKQRVHDVAAAEVARIAFDEHAQSAAFKVSNSLATQMTNNDELLFPTTQFPFIGYTNLRVYGKWCGNDAFRTFVVFGILNCSSAFPFNFLNFFRDAPGDKNPDEDDKKPGGKDSAGRPKPRKKRPTNNNGIEPQLTETPDSELFDLNITLEQRTTFGDLIKPEKLRLAPFKPKTGCQSPINTKDVDTGNAGDGKRAGRGAPLSFTSDNNNDNSNPDDGRTVFDFKINRLSMFDEVCSIIESMPRVNGVTFRLSREAFADHYARFPHVTNENGIKVNWSYSNYIKGIQLDKNQKKELRKVAIAEIDISNKKIHVVYVFEVERRVQARSNGWVELDDPALFIVKPSIGERLTDYQLSVLIRKCAEKRGIWPINDTSFECYSIKHPDNNTIKKGNTYKDKFIEIIQKKIGYSFEH